MSRARRELGELFHVEDRYRGAAVAADGLVRQVDGRAAVRAVNRPDALPQLRELLRVGLAQEVLLAQPFLAALHSLVLTQRLLAKQEQALRNAVATLSPRCQQLVHMLFYETPSRPYAEIASQLGLAAGSIGFIRGRCLEKLRRALGQAGFQ